MSKYVVLGFEKFIYLDGLNSCRNNAYCNYYMCSLCGYLLVRKNEWFKFVTEVLTRESKKKMEKKNNKNEIGKSECNENKQFIVKINNLYK